MAVATVHIIETAVPARRRQPRAVTFMDSAAMHPLEDTSPMHLSHQPSLTILGKPIRNKSGGPSCKSPSRVQFSAPESHHGGRRPAMRRMHTMVAPISDAELHAMMGGPAAHKNAAPQRRAKSMGAALSRHVAVSVVAPGGGTGCNAAAYAALGREDGVSVAIKGQSRAPYDRYPPAWEEGAPAPNLETFALDLLSQGIVEYSDCLVVGSRGGQVVLPALWRERGNDVPPAVVINGGCANKRPTPVHWPEDAVTLLLLGGQDYFKGHQSSDQYIASTQKYVPNANTTTAIVFVREMAHMPQTELLNASLLHMIHAVTTWKSSGEVPSDELLTTIRALSIGGWSGSLLYKTAMGSLDSWQVVDFP